MIQFLKVGADSRALAEQSVIEGLFNTITCTLEPGGRGSRFPAAMERLCQGSLNPSEAPAALRELQEIEEAMRKTPVAAVAWKPGDPRRGDDPARPANHQAANAFEYFIDVDGRPLITRLQEGVHQSIINEQALRYEAPGETFKVICIGLVGVALGVAWMWLGHKFLPRLTISKGYARGHGIPVWTFGMYLVMFGAVLSITAPLPALRDWFFRRPWMVLALTIAAVIGWLAICGLAGFLPD